ncbi:DUF6544 family protein [uncultured Sulfitobacter sp.]|uniref:DUF6544 family protein n=1 Tax=uncultured Sulfitobacter sp. TaxID=191468 RepID=UPI002606956F|nr:DUF6544 family protein [uncultured Sulfitobacter sp.]
MGKWIFIGTLTLIFAGAVIWVVANVRYRKVMAQAEVAWSDLAARNTSKPLVYSANLVADLPEVAQRYFNHAIASGTPLYLRAELAMSGEFLLGEKDKQQSYAMQARQILAPPNAFVWIAEMTNGPVRINGSDGLYNKHGWTRFWMFQSLPLVQVAATPDLDRAAAARPAIEAIWVPATLLPANGAVWVQTGANTAKVIFGEGAEARTLFLKIAVSGALEEVWTERWSDANPAKIYQMQPFGGITEAQRQFGGYTIPSQVTVGNQFGTPDFLPFFRADLTSVRYF